MASVSEDPNTKVIEDGEVDRISKSDKEILVSDDENPQPATFSQCRGCSYYMEPLLLVFVLSYMVIFIVTPQYILGRELKRLTGDENIKINTNSCHGDPNSNPSNETIQDDPVTRNYSMAQSAAAYFSLQSSFVTSIPTMVVVVFIGPYSDKRGRKLALVLSLIGFTLSALNMALNAYFELPIYIILVGNFFYGCTGYWVAFYMACFSYVADVTSKEDRHFRTVLLQVSSQAPAIISGAASGFLVSSLGFAMVFLIAFFIDVLMIIYVIFVVPEPVKRDPTAKFFSLQHIKKSIMVIALDDKTRRRWKLLTLLLAFFVCTIVGFGGNVFLLFMMNFPLCWGSELVGIINSIYTATSVVGSALAAKIFGLFLRDAWIALLGVIMDGAFFVYMFFVATTTMMFISAVFQLLFIIFTPTIRAMLSKLVQPDEVGAVFGCFALIEVVCGLLQNAILNPIYSETQAMGHPNSVFLVMAAFYITSAIIMMTYGILTRRKPLME